jgi:hypothetical protein
VSDFIFSKCRWLELRQEAELFYGIKNDKGACKGIGQNNYLTMNLENARIPSAGPFAVLTKVLRKDDSAEIF